MLVFNLTHSPISFRKRVIPPNGGSLEFPELNEFIPDRDKALEKAKVLSFGSLPKWWVSKKKEEAAKAAVKPALKNALVSISDSVEVQDKPSYKQTESHKSYKRHNRG